MAADENQKTKMRWSLKQVNEGQNRALRVFDGSLSSQEFGDRASRCIRYLFLRHQGLFILSPRHPDLQEVQDNWRRIWMGDARCRLKSRLASKTSRSCRCTSTTTMPRNTVLERSSSLEFVPLCKMSTWAKSPVISTEEQHGVQQVVTTLIRPVLLRKQLPTRTFQCHQAPHHFGVLKLFLWMGWRVRFHRTLKLTLLWRARLHGAFTISQEIPVSVKETRVATMMSGCIQTSSATDTHTDHERTTIIVYVSRKSLAPTHQPRKEEGMITEVTIHCHPCRRHVNTCFHQQAQLIIWRRHVAFTSALQGHEHLTWWEAFSLCVVPLLSCHFHVIARASHMSMQHPSN